MNTLTFLNLFLIAVTNSEKINDGIYINIHGAVSDSYFDNGLDVTGYVLHSDRFE